MFNWRWFWFRLKRVWELRGRCENCGNWIGWWAIRRGEPCCFSCDRVRADYGYYDDLDDEDWDYEHEPDPACTCSYCWDYFYTDRDWEHLGPHEGGGY